MVKVKVWEGEMVDFGVIFMFIVFNLMILLGVRIGVLGIVLVGLELMMGWLLFLRWGFGRGWMFFLGVKLVGG